MSRTPTAALPVEVRWMLLGTAVSRFGTGLTLPFTVILLNEVRGIALPAVGLLLAVSGAVGLVSVPVSGALVDRLGPRIVLRGSLVLVGLANAVLALAETVPVALVAVTVLGLGLGPSFPASNALLAGFVEGVDQEQRAYGLQFTILNAAIGTGGLVAATIVDVERAGTFVALFLTNAVASLIAAVIVPRARPRPASAGPGDGLPPPSYREVLADRTFRRVCLTSLLFAMTGYAALDAGLPAFARVVGRVDPSVIALVFTVNTALIVGGQLLVIRVLRGRRRSSALAAAALVWAASWAFLALVPLLGDGGRIAVVLVFGALFGLGEILMAPTLQPLVNALATDRLRGRYNAMSGSTFSVAFVVSPAVSALLIGNDLGVLWLGLLVLGCLLSAALAVALGRQLTPAQDGLGDDPSPVPDPADSLVG